MVKVKKNRFTWVSACHISDFDTPPLVAITISSLCNRREKAGKDNPNEWKGFSDIPSFPFLAIYLIKAQLNSFNDLIYQSKPTEI